LNNESADGTDVVGGALTLGVGVFAGPTYSGNLPAPS
jgi:hypothetical protein